MSGEAIFMIMMGSLIDYLHWPIVVGASLLRLFNDVITR